MRKIKAFHIIVSILFISSCLSVNTNPDFEDVPVVQGYLHANKPLEIKISRQIPYSSKANYSLDNLDSLEIKIFDGNLYYSLVSDGNGKYINPDIDLNQLDSFEIEFNFNNVSVSASTNIPSKPENFSSSVSNVYVSILPGNNPDEITFTWDNTNSRYYFLLIENIESNPISIYDNVNIANINQLFNLAPTQSDSYTMRTRRFSYYGKHRIILFHINPDLAALYEENDNTSQNISNPPTGLKNAFGIFTGINSDTLYVNVKAR